MRPESVASRFSADDLIIPAIKAKSKMNLLSLLFTAALFLAESVTGFSAAPKPGETIFEMKKTMFPYQEEGVERLLKGRRVLLADEMGLGKTVQAIGALNSLTKRKQAAQKLKVLIVCPKSVLGVWETELEEWLDRHDQMSIDVATAKHFPETGCNIVLINYDICHKFSHELRRLQPYDVIICDEAHYLKSTTTKRTIALLGEESGPTRPLKANYLWLLTGTPIMNRPIELYPMLHAIAPREFEYFEDFCKQYCGEPVVKKYRGKYVEVYSGSSNLRELSQRLRPVMIRRFKIDVLDQLPPKIRSCVCLPQDGNAISEIEKSMMEEIFKGRRDQGHMKLDDFGSIARSLSTYVDGDSEELSSNQVMGEIAKIRQATALQKLQPSIEILKEMVLNDEKVVVFCHHRQLITELVDEFKGECVHIIGGMDRKQRAEAVKQFMTNDSIKVFVGSIRAAGVGITLTSASRVVFLELDWSPAIMSQAEDRCHRVGQQDCVQVQYFVFRNTLDEWIARSLVRKQMDIDKALTVVEVGDVPNRYEFDFGKHEGVRLEDVPKSYLGYIVGKKDIWQKRLNLWKALAHMGLVKKPPVHLGDNPAQLTPSKQRPPSQRKHRQQSKSPQVDFVFDFGKHRGKKWNDVPEDYREWIIREGVWQKRDNLKESLTSAGLV